MHGAFFLWHDWCIEGFPVISYLHLVLHSALVSVRSYICLFSCGRSPNRVSWMGLLHDSFPGCQLSLLLSFQHAWFFWSEEDTLLCSEAVLSGGQQQLRCGPYFPVWILQGKKHSFFQDYLRNCRYWTSRGSFLLWPLPEQLIGVPQLQAIIFLGKF